MQRALSDVVRSDVDELRELEVDRLDAMHTQLWARLMEPGTDVFPKMDVVTLLLRVSEQRSKLLGLYPTGDTGKKRTRCERGHGVALEATRRFTLIHAHVPAEKTGSASRCTGARPRRDERRP